jgi:heme oxygenase
VFIFMGSNLAGKLRSGTKKAHTAAENVGFVRCFLKGVVEKNSYRKLVSSFYYVYSEMEEHIRSHQEHPVVGKIYFPLLERKYSLERDLEFYYGADWQTQISPSTETDRYVQRIKAISDSEPELLVAHSYTRYLGDLSGGQILKGIAQRALDLPTGVGVAFYEFQDIADEKQFKMLYRQRLDEMPIDDATGDRIVHEANTVFDLNMKIFKELEGSFVKAVGKVLFNTLTRRRPRESAELIAAE